ncbi:MAG TPA: hypothetical protein DCS66_12925, partial [Flavobacteriaceae bacterium]|nr:hypothetical protein [Flavobacteriaceae bacterium]
KIYKEYGIIAERLLPDYAKGFDRSKDDYLNALDQTMALNENLEDPSFGELVKMVFTPGVKPYIPSFERGLVTLKESHRHLVEGTKLAWNELQITLQKETLESRNRVVENLKQQIGGGPFTGGGSGIELDMKISEARQLDPSGQLNRYLVAYRGTRDDNLTVGEFFDQRKSALDETVESMETDYMEMADAYKELGKLNKLDGDEAFLSLEGFMQHLALGYQQASHMSFSLAGTGFFTAGTVLSGSGVGASAGVPLMYTGGALMAVGASIQGAMTYSSVYMEAVRRQMQKDPKYANREISGEEFIEALKNPKYGNQMSALGAGGSVIVTELLSDIGMAYAGGKVGGLVFKNPFINKLTRNSFTNYLTNITTAGITYEANIWKEFGTEGFQNYLEQGFTNLSVGEESPFTKNIDTAQMLEDAEAGKKVGRLFGISSVSGAIGGRSQIADIMLGSYTSRAKAIATKLKMQPGSSTSITVENLFKDLKNEIENDLNLTNKEKRNEIKNISNIRNAGLAVPIIITKKNKGKLINLLVEQKELENKIKEKNNKQLSVVDIERKQVVDGEIESIIRESVVQEESLKGPTSPMGMFGVGKEKITAEEQADLNKINIDLYKDSTDETTRNNAIKDIIEDNAGFFLSDKGGIN